MSQKQTVVEERAFGSIGRTNVAETTIDYQMVTYLKYDFACPADHAKKILEKDLVQREISARFDLLQASAFRSLDIGCATGRYPTWFGELGFHAHGYDIAAKAIEICTERAADLPNVSFEQKNILEEDVEKDKFDLITCMMGTFNHIPTHQRALFLNKIYDMLKPGGVLIFSSWNAACSYTNYLQFYTREEREHLEQHSTDSETIARVLDDAHLHVESIAHFACFTDECYEAWASVLQDQDKIELDETMRPRLGTRNAQMYLVTAVKDAL